MVSPSKPRNRGDSRQTRQDPKYGGTNPASWERLPRINATKRKAALPPETVLQLESVNKLLTLGSMLSKDGIFFRSYPCTDESRKINQRGL